MWKPKKGQKYYMMNSRFEVKQSEYTGSKKAIDRVAAGNCFKDKTEANAFAYLVRQAAKGNFIGFKRRWWRFW